MSQVSENSKVPQCSTILPEAESVISKDEEISLEEEEGGNKSLGSVRNSRLNRHNDVSVLSYSPLTRSGRRKNSEENLCDIGSP